MKRHGQDAPIQGAMRADAMRARSDQLQAPALVIMDITMPVLDGHDAFKQIKEIDKNANVVIITAYSDFELKNQEAIRLGLVEVIPKPIVVNELINLVKKYTETNEDKT